VASAAIGARGVPSADAGARGVPRVDTGTRGVVGAGAGAFAFAFALASARTSAGGVPGMSADGERERAHARWIVRAARSSSGLTMSTAWRGASRARVLRHAVWIVAAAAAGVNVGTRGLRVR
jgi:hypothetical protein